MFNRFLALDVETSNSDRSSICQVGWVLFENGNIISEFSSLVNPHSAFLPRNIQVHGIQPHHVANAALVVANWTHYQPLWKRPTGR